MTNSSSFQQTMHQSTLCLFAKVTILTVWLKTWVLTVHWAIQNTATFIVLYLRRTLITITCLCERLLVFLQVMMIWLSLLSTIYWNFTSVLTNKGILLGLLNAWQNPFQNSLLHYLQWSDCYCDKTYSGSGVNHMWILKNLKNLQINVSFFQ